MKNSLSPIAALMKELGDITMQIGMQSMMDKGEMVRLPLTTCACWPLRNSATSGTKCGQVSLATSTGDDAKFYKSKIATVTLLPSISRNRNPEAEPEVGFQSGNGNRRRRIVLFPAVFNER